MNHESIITIIFTFFSNRSSAKIVFDSSPYLITDQMEIAGLS